MAAAKHLFLLFHSISMQDNELPRKIPAFGLCASQAEMEVAEEIKKYNKLPVGDPRRRAIYDKILDLRDYSQNWD